jgi:hypothetical protein
MIDTDTYLWFCRAALVSQRDIVLGLGDERANARPDLPGANSAYAILTHCLGVMRYWASTVNRGITIPRDRPAEFTASGPVAALAERADSVWEEFEVDVRTSLPHEPPVAPPADREGMTEPWVGTQGGVLLHVYEELSQHLGQMEITRDVVRSAR